MTEPGVPRVPRDFSVFGDWIGETFRLWSAQWQVWVLQGLIFFCIVILPFILLYFGGFITMIAASSRTGGGEPPDSTVLGFMGVIWLIAIICSVFSAALVPGMIKTALKQMRGEPIAVGDIFSGVRYFWGFIAVGFLTGLGVIGCGIGTYVLAGLLYLAVPLMVDDKATTGRAISLSWDTTKQNFWLYLLYSFVMMMIGGAGTAVCYIGIIVSFPIMLIAQAVAYERTFFDRVSANGPGSAQQQAGRPQAYLPPPPYVANTPPQCPRCGKQLPEDGSPCSCEDNQAT